MKKVFNFKIVALLVVVVVILFTVFLFLGNGKVDYQSCSNFDSYTSGFSNAKLLVGKHKISTHSQCDLCHKQAGNNASKNIFASVLAKCPTVNEMPAVTRDNCLSCHNDPSKVKEVFSKTKERVKFKVGDRVYKLHDNHTQEQECSTCHKGHGNSKLLCAQCHHAKWIMTLEKNGWEE